MLLLRLKAVTDDPIVWQTNHLSGAPTPVSPQTGIPFEVPSAGFYLNLPALSAEDGQTGAFWLGAGPAWSLPNARWRGAVVCLRATGSRSPTTPRVTSGAAWAKARTGLAAAEDACWDKAATTITPDATAPSRRHPDRPPAGRGHLNRRTLRPPTERAHQRRDLRRQRIRRRALDHPRRRRGVRHDPGRRFRPGRGHRHRWRRLAGLRDRAVPGWLGPLLAEPGRDRDRQHRPHVRAEQRCQPYRRRQLRALPLGRGELPARRSARRAPISRRSPWPGSGC